MATTLTCPKCQGVMRSYERSGVTVDQCTDCRGIFLDRGELEHLVDAEQSWTRRRPSRDHDDDDDDDGGDRGYDRDREVGFPNPFGERRHSGEGSHKRRKKSFFDELFD